MKAVPDDERGGQNMTCARRKRTVRTMVWWLLAVYVTVWKVGHSGQRWDIDVGVFNIQIMSIQQRPGRY
jgi:hypothetical protein